MSAAVAKKTNHVIQDGISASTSPSLGNSSNSSSNVDLNTIQLQNAGKSSHHETNKAITSGPPHPLQKAWSSAYPTSAGVDQLADSVTGQLTHSEPVLSSMPPVNAKLTRNDPTYSQQSAANNVRRRPPPTTRNYSPHTQTLGRNRNNQASELMAEANDEGNHNATNLNTLLNRPLTRNGLRKLRSKSLPGFPSWLMAMRTAKNAAKAASNPNSGLLGNRSPSTLAVGLNGIPTIAHKKDSKHLLYTGSITQCDDGGSSDTESADESTCSSSSTQAHTPTSPKPFGDVSPRTNTPDTEKSNDSSTGKGSTSDNTSAVNKASTSSPKTIVSSTNEKSSSKSSKDKKDKKSKDTTETMAIVTVTKDGGEKKEKMKEKTKEKMKEKSKTKSSSKDDTSLNNKSSKTSDKKSKSSSKSGKKQNSTLDSGEAENPGKIAKKVSRSSTVSADTDSYSSKLKKDPLSTSSSSSTVSTSSTSTTVTAVSQSKPGQRRFVTAFDWIKSFAAGQAEIGPQLESSESEEDLGYVLDQGTSDEDYDEEELALISDTDDVSDSDRLLPTPSISSGTGLLTPTLPSSTTKKPRGATLSPSSSGSSISISKDSPQQYLALPSSPRSLKVKKSSDPLLDSESESGASVKEAYPHSTLVPSSSSPTANHIAIASHSNNVPTAKHHSPLTDAFMSLQTNGGSAFGPELLNTVSPSSSASTRSNSRRKTDRPTKKREEKDNQTEVERVLELATSIKPVPKSTKRGSSKRSTSRSPVEGEGVSLARSGSKEGAPQSTRAGSASPSKTKTRPHAPSDSSRPESFKKKKDSVGEKSATESGKLLIPPHASEASGNASNMEPWKKSPDIVKLRKRSLRVNPSSTLQSSDLYGEVKFGLAASANNTPSTTLQIPIAAEDVKSNPSAIAAAEPEEFEEDGIRYIKISANAAPSTPSSSGSSKTIAAITLERLLSVIFEGDWNKERVLREEFLMVMPFCASATAALEGIADLWASNTQRNAEAQTQLQQRVVTFLLEWVKLTFTYYTDPNVLDALFKLLDKLVVCNANSPPTTSSPIHSNPTSPQQPRHTMAGNSVASNPAVSTSPVSLRLILPPSGAAPSTYTQSSTMERDLIQRIVQYKLAGIDPRNLAGLVVQMKHSKYGVKFATMATSSGSTVTFQGSDALKWLKKLQEDHVETPHASFFKRFQSKVDGLMDKAPVSARGNPNAPTPALNNSSQNINAESGVAMFLEIDNFEVLNQLLADKLIVQVSSKTGEPRPDAEPNFNKKKSYAFCIDPHVEANALVQNIRPIELPAPGTASSSDPASHDFQDVFCSTSPDTFAKQLTILESSLFQRIEPHELHYWLKGDKAKRVKAAPNLHRVISNLNRMSSWVATEIVTTANPKQRIAILKRFILIAQYCLKYRNYQGLLEIMGGLANTSVRRLTAWGTLPEKYHNMYDRLSEIVNPGQNWKNYRPLIERESQACIPYIGLFLADLTFIHDSVKSELPDGRLNWKKAARLVIVMSSIRKMQRRAYAFAPDFQILKYLTENITVLDEKELFNQSRLLEPTRARSGSIY